MEKVSVPSLAHQPESQTTGRSQWKMPSIVKSIDRRGFLSMAASLAALTGMSRLVFARNFDSDSEPSRYPDPDILVLDNRFKKYKIGNTPIQRLYRGTLWAEGPAWNE